MIWNIFGDEARPKVAGGFRVEPCSGLGGLERKHAACHKTCSKASEHVACASCGQPRGSARIGAGVQGGAAIGCVLPTHTGKSKQRN